MKRITFGIIAFFLTFGISASIVGLLFGFPKVGRDRHHAHHSSEAVTIENVLDQDIRYGEFRRRSEVRLAREAGGNNQRLVIPAGTPEHARIIERYYSSMAGIDVSRTPADFKYAWKKHMEAWNGAVGYTNALAAGDLETSNFKDYDPQEINETYYQVLRIAKRYGSHIKARYLR